MESKIETAQIISGLGTGRIGRRVLCFDRLPSTMDAARSEIKAGAAEGTVIITTDQTAGRGRMGRTWLSPGGGIALSIILYPPLELLPSLIMLASVAVMRTIAGVTGLKAAIKWPNDLLLDGRKVCGILVESGVRGRKVEYAIIGIGINVDLDTGNYPDIAGTATSLAREAGRPVPATALVRRLLRETDGLYASVLAGTPVFPEWRDNLITLGHKVRASCGEEVYEGIAESVMEDGSLNLRQQDGHLVRVVAGDVSLSH